MNTTERKQVKLRATSLTALRNLVHQTPLDLDCGGPRRHLDGAVTITAFVTDQDIVDIRDTLGVEIIDIRAVDSVRRSDIGTGDRFKGGRLFPRGFGRFVPAGKAG